jgi:glycosyltransferase involved in cell wall biosynthesis
LSQHLAELGHEVAVFAFVGCAYGDTEWTGCLGHTIKVFGNPLRNSHAFVERAAAAWKADVVVAWFDIWTVAALLGTLKLPRLVLYAPVDSSPVAGLLAEGLKHAEVVVPYCHFAYAELRAAGLDCASPIYHGCDTDLYRPGDQATARQAFGIPDGPLFVTVKANNGERSNYPGQLAAFRTVVDRAHYWAWAYPYMDTLMPDAWDLEGMWDSLDGPRGKLLLPDPWTYLEGLPDEKMPQLYACADWLVNCTLGEGFGFPIIEAMACEVPVIVSDWSSMPELVKPDRGLVVSASTPFPCQATYSWQMIPDAAYFTAKLNEALDMPPADRALMGQRGRRWVKEHCDWRVVAKEWDTLLRSV